MLTPSNRQASYSVTAWHLPWMDWSNSLVPQATRSCRVGELQQGQGVFQVMFTREGGSSLLCIPQAYFIRRTSHIAQRHRRQAACGTQPLTFCVISGWYNKGRGGTLCLDMVSHSTPGWASSVVSLCTLFVLCHCFLGSA
jgi:hypothetical protein